MTPQPVPTPTPIRGIDDLVAEYHQLADQVLALQERQAAVRGQLRQLGLGEHRTSNGHKVTVRMPNRRFNAVAAARLLAPEVLELCKAEPTYDTKKLKSFLSPVLLDQCMDAGVGDYVVTVG